MPASMVEPPQSFTTEQEFSFASRPYRVLINPPNGMRRGGIIPPGLERIEETVGIFDLVILDDGIDTGFVIVAESPS